MQAAGIVLGPRACGLKMCHLLAEALEVSFLGPPLCMDPFKMTSTPICHPSIGCQLLGPDSLCMFIAENLEKLGKLIEENDNYL